MIEREGEKERSSKRMRDRKRTGVREGARERKSRRKRDGEREQVLSK